MRIHVVKKGESLFSIAQQYGVSARLLQKQNEVPADGTLVTGQTLVILLPEKTHIVRSGDTVYSIARKYGVSAREIFQNNIFLQGQGTLTPGEELIVTLKDAPKDGALGVNGYAYPFIDPALLSAVLPFQSALTPFTYGITASGGLLPLADDALLAAARQRGVRPVMHLSDRKSVV